jgi:hypothetical protein
VRKKVAESYHYSAANGKRAAEPREKTRLAAAGQFQLQKELISGRMPLTAEATVSRLRRAAFSERLQRIAVSSARSATRISGSGQKE